MSAVRTVRNNQRANIGPIYQRPTPHRSSAQTDAIVSCRCANKCARTPLGYADIPAYLAKRHKNQEQLSQLRSVPVPGPPAHVALVGARVQDAPNPAPPVVIRSLSPVLSPNQQETLLHHNSPAHALQDEMQLDFLDAGNGADDASSDNGRSPAAPLRHTTISRPPSPELVQNLPPPSINLGDGESDPFLALPAASWARPISQRAAARESRHIRFAYLTAALGRAFQNQTVEHATDILRSMLTAYELVGQLPQDPQPVTTLDAAMRRLGIDPDEEITAYASCEVCWKMFSPLQLSQLDSPSCTTPDCRGEVYKIKTNTRGPSFREPLRIVPYCSLIRSLRRMMLRPGFAASIRDSRNLRVPSDDENRVMEDASDAPAWFRDRTRMTRNFQPDGTCVDSPSSKQGAGAPLTSHRYGLHFVINLDWLGITAGRPHSTGAVYTSIADLPISQRLSPLNVVCNIALPGPTEPNAEQLCNAAEPLREELALLQHGVSMNVHGEDEPQDVFGDTLCNGCDSPARCKLNGGAAHSHKKCPCAWCECDHARFNDAAIYLGTTVPVLTDDATWLRRSWVWLQSIGNAATSAFKQHGIRWAVFNALPGWLPRSKQTLDFMHCFYLGVVHHLWSSVLIPGYLLTKQGGPQSAARRFETTLNSIQWPSTIGRLPQNIADNQSLKKADEWRRLLCVLPVTLWAAWRAADDTIPIEPPPLPPKTSKVPEFNRSPRAILNAVIDLAVAGRIWPSHKISLAQARFADQSYRDYCATLLELNVPLRPNHHWMLHLVDDVIRPFGPIPGTWLFAFERLNGLLEKIRLNGHNGGRMELTIMRHWVRTHLLYEYLLCLPDTDEYQAERGKLLLVVRDERQRGTLLTQLAVAVDEEQGTDYSLPKSSQAVDLHKLARTNAIYVNVYKQLLDFARSVWQNRPIIAEGSTREGVLFVASTAARSFPFIRKAGTRYSSTTNQRSPADRIAMLKTSQGLAPAEIQMVLTIQIAGETPVPCLLVRHLKSVPGNEGPSLPWHLVAEELGIHDCFAARYHGLEVVPISTLHLPLAIIPIEPQTYPHKLWICVSLDRTGYEFEEL